MYSGTISALDFISKFKADVSKGKTGGTRLDLFFRLARDCKILPVNQTFVYP